jgi:hypothetical protein
MTGIAGTCHRAQPFGWDGISLIFCLNWSQTIVLLVSASWVAVITVVSHHTCPEVFNSYNCLYFFNWHIKIIHIYGALSSISIHVHNVWCSAHSNHVSISSNIHHIFIVETFKILPSSFRSIVTNSIQRCITACQFFLPSDHNSVHDHPLPTPTLPAFGKHHSTLNL